MLFDSLFMYVGASFGFRCGSLSPREKKEGSPSHSFDDSVISIIRLLHALTGGIWMVIRAGCSISVFGQLEKECSTVGGAYLEKISKIPPSKKVLNTQKRRATQAKS